MNASNNAQLANELEGLLQELTMEDLAELPDDKILEFRKKLNPYGRTIEGSDKYLNFSITQISHKYWEKFLTTALIGYLNRMNDEWKVPEGVPVVPVYDYLEDSSKLDTPQNILDKDYKKAIDDYEFNREWMKKRIIVKEFLEEMFQFNPDEHVRSAHRPNLKNKRRKPINTQAGQLVTKHLQATDKEFASDMALKKDLESSTNAEKKLVEKIVVKTIKGRDGKTRTIKKTVMVPVDEADGTDYSVDPSERMAPDMTDPHVQNTVREIIPPHDTFGRFKMYRENNYEKLRDAVQDLYSDAPELELSINPYAVHDTAEEAENFKKKHSGEVIAEIFTAHFGKWNFFDTFKEQRESVNFYNENTVILEEMVKQLERDEKLGQDLMKKRVSKLKKKNELEAGPDAESFKKWREQNTTLKDMGAEHITNDDVPDDAIQVDVWKVAKGGLELTKDKFYSQAEAPTFVKEAQDKAMAQSGSQGPPTTE